MNNLKKITFLVQSFIDRDSAGEVTYAPDYIPGNFCLDQPDSHPVSRERDLQGNLLLRRRYSLRVRCYSTVPVSNDLENLDDFLAINGDTPMWLQDFHTEPHVSGIWIHSAKICMEHETDLSKEET